MPTTGFMEWWLSSPEMFLSGWSLIWVFMRHLSQHRYLGLFYSQFVCVSSIFRLFHKPPLDCEVSYETPTKCTTDHHFQHLFQVHPNAWMTFMSEQVLLATLYMIYVVQWMIVGGLADLLVIISTHTCRMIFAYFAGWTTPWSVCVTTFCAVFEYVGINLELHISLSIAALYLTRPLRTTLCHILNLVLINVLEAWTS